MKEGMAYLFGFFFCIFDFETKSRSSRLSTLSVQVGDIAPGLGCVIILNHCVWKTFQWGSAFWATSWRQWWQNHRCIWGGRLQLESNLSLLKRAGDKESGNDLLNFALIAVSGYSGSPETEEKHEFRVEKIHNFTSLSPKCDWYPIKWQQ